MSRPTQASSPPKNPETEHEQITRLLWKAITDNSPGDVELFINHGADVNSIKEGYSPLLKALAGGKDFRIIKSLITNGADPNYRYNSYRGLTPLENTITMNATREALFLLNHGADANYINSERQTMVQYAIRFNRPNIAKSILSSTDIDVNNVDTHGDTALILATQINMYDMVKFLLRRGANPNYINSYSKTSLSIAINYNHLDTAMLLLQHGATYNNPDNHGITEYNYMIANPSFSGIIQAIDRGSLAMSKVGGFGRRRKHLKITAIPQKIKKECRRLNIKLTRKLNNKRIHKSLSSLKKEIKNRKKKISLKSYNSLGKPKISAIQAVRNGTHRLKGTNGKWYCISKKRHLNSRPKWILCKNK